ncbi:MAG: hypothetical protein IPJ66_13160 [Bacteroidetes bacterium]|nr:hypothetical protein [Bacteroidota bacterium]MBL0064156.1 hypothetical protein [Bacteroidota bacterium]MBL0139462.1 hypothetical protein [Bacteroidota bacterium]
MLQSIFCRQQFFLFIFFFRLIDSAYSNQFIWRETHVQNDSGSQINNINKFSNFKLEDHNLNFCLSFLQSQFLQDKNVYSLGLSEKYALNFRFVKCGLNWRFCGKSDLGFVYIIDSIWLKSNDYLEFYINGSEKRNKTFESSYSLLFISQTLPTYSYYNQDMTKRRVQIGGFLNPGVLQLAYGFEYKVREMGRIVCSLATIRLHSFKEFIGSNQDQADQISRVDLDYGFSLDFDCKKNFKNRLEISTNLHFFVNSFTKDKIKYNSDLCIRYLFSELIILQCTARINFDSEISRKFIFQSQLSLGLNYKINH